MIYTQQVIEGVKNTNKNEHFLGITIYGIERE